MSPTVRNYSIVTSCPQEITFGNFNQSRNPGSGGDAKRPTWITGLNSLRVESIV